MMTFNIEHPKNRGNSDNVDIRFVDPEYLSELSLTRIEPEAFHTSIRIVCEGGNAMRRKYGLERRRTCYMLKRFCLIWTAPW